MKLVKTLASACLAILLLAEGVAAQRTRRPRPAASKSETITEPEALPFCRVPGAQTITRKIRIVVNESYPDAPSVKSDIAISLESLLRTAGFVVSSDNDSMILKTVVRGSALGADYVGGIGYCYNGAKISGNLFDHTRA